jgi:GT2 family glycosyltransferase
VLLVSWNRREETRRCLESLHATAGVDLEYEVVAVDNGSRDGSAELLAADPRVRLIRNSRNVGFAAAVNQAYRESSGELILLLNNDVQFHPGALDRMVRFLRDRPDAAGVSPLYLNPDGTFQQHYVQLPSLPAAIGLFSAVRKLPGFRRALHRFQLRGEDFSRPRRLASGSCQLLRRAVLGRHQILDERFPIYWNDALLARGLDLAGYEVWMIPDAVVTHTRGATCRLLGPAVRFRHLLGGMVCFLRLTRPAYQVLVLRAVLILDHLGKTLCGRPRVLRLPDLLAALRGDVGPVPDGDTRDWLIVVGRAAVSTMDDDQRMLVVDPPGGRIRWRFSVDRLGADLWHARLSTVLPGGRFLPPVRWFNLRVGSAQLRRWLDGYAGARILFVDRAEAAMIGRVGEDAVGSAPRPEPVAELTHA